MKNSFDLQLLAKITIWRFLFETWRLATRPQIQQCQQRLQINRIRNIEQMMDTMTINLLIS